MAYDDNVEMVGDDLFAQPGPLDAQRALAENIRRRNPALAMPTSGVQAPKPAAAVRPPQAQAQAPTPPQGPTSADLMRQIADKMGQRPDASGYIEQARERGQNADRDLVLSLALGNMGGENMRPLANTLAQRGLDKGAEYEIPGGWGHVSRSGKVVWNPAKQQEEDLKRLALLHGQTLTAETSRENARDRAADRRLTADATAAQRADTASRAREGLDLRQQQARLENENRYRDDFNTTTKNTRDVLESARVLQTIPSSGKLSPVQQQSLIILLNKFQDPGSVVREGEFDRVKLAQGMLQRWGNVPAMIQSGQILSPALQKDLQNVIKLYNDAAENTMRSFGEQYVGMARSDNLRPEHIVTDRRWHPSGARPGGPQGGRGGSADSPIRVEPRAGGAAAPSNTIKVPF